MAATVAERAWRPSTAESIDEDLTAMWREIAQRAPMSRAVMSNLVVFCRCSAGRPVDLTTNPPALPIDEVASRHPARVILLHHDPDAPGEKDALAGLGATLAAHVGVLAFGPADARYGIEQIVIQSACGEAALPSIVRQLVLGDVPTSVWWTEDFSGTGPVAPLITMGRQLLYDSRRWGDVRRAVLALAPALSDQLGPDLADVNWRRLLPVRQAVVHAVKSRENRNGRDVASVQIRHRPGEAALAWLFAGWLRNAWGPQAIPIRLKPDPTIAAIAVEEDADLRDDILIASFGDGLRLRLDPHRVSVEDPLGPAPFVLAVPRETEGQAIAAELSVLTQDIALRDALRALVQWFGRA